MAKKSFKPDYNACIGNNKHENFGSIYESMVNCCILPKKPEIIKLTHAYYMIMRNLTVMSLKIMFHQIRKLKSSTR